MFKVNNKDTRTTSMAHLSYTFHTLFYTPCVSIVKIEHVIAGWGIDIIF